MQATAQYNPELQAISVDYQRKLMRLRYVTDPVEHVRKFYMRKASEYSQMRYVVGTESSYDPIMSDAR